MRAKLKFAKPMVIVLATAFLLSGCHYYYPYGYHHGSSGHHGHHKHKRGHY